MSNNLPWGVNAGMYGVWDESVFTGEEWNNRHKSTCECGINALNQNYEDQQHSDYCPVYIAWKEKNETKK